MLCRTAGRQEKEKAIRKRFSSRMEEALKRLAKAIETGRLKDRNKMERRLGRIQASHPQVSDLYDVVVRETHEGLRLQWSIKEDRKVWHGLREGAYMLRTNLPTGSAEELWSHYMQLTEAEASFRALKSELSVRPLFHQLEPRQGTRDGRLSRVRSLGHSEAFAERPRRNRPTAIIQQPQQGAAVIRYESPLFALDPSECRHCPADYRRSRDPPAPYY